MPIIDHQCRRRNLVRDENAQGVPVEIPQREAERPGHVSEAKVRHCPPVHGEVGGDLGDGGDDEEDQDGHEDVRAEQQGGPADGEGLSRPHEEAGADGASQGHHLRVTGFEAALGLGVPGIEEICFDEGLDGGFVLLVVILLTAVGVDCDI